MSPPVRIASLLPSATEIVCALGLGDRLVLRSHECDHPAQVRAVPSATRSKLDPDGSSFELEDRVRALVSEGLSVYRVDAEALRAAAPDVILTQDQCQVCAVPASDIRRATWELLDDAPRVVSLSPATLDDVLGSVVEVADALGVLEGGRALRQHLRQRIDAVAREASIRSRAAGRPRVLTIEWLDPLMVGGNWMPELVALAGGTNVAGEAGAHSPFVEWDVLRGLDPDVIVVAPCGFPVDRTRREMETLTGLDGWGELRAVTSGRVALADGHHYFNRPGPRIVESLEILAEILHGSVREPRHRGRGWEPLGAPSPRGVEPWGAGP